MLCLNGQTFSSRTGKTSGLPSWLINPKFSVDAQGKLNIHKDQAVVENAMNAWRKAGLK